MEECMLGGFFCNQFFQLMEGCGQSESYRRTLLMMSEKYITSFKDDNVPNLKQLALGAAKAANTIAVVLSSILVLLDPTPGKLGTNEGSVTDIVAYNGDQQYLNMMKLYLADEGFWQGKVDECLKSGTSSLKLGPQMTSLTEKLQLKSDDDFLVSNDFKDAVLALPTYRETLRPGATEKFEAVLSETCWKIAEHYCSLATVEGLSAQDVGLIDSCLNLLPKKVGFLELRSKLAKWQGSMANALCKSTLSQMALDVSASMRRSENKEISWDEVADIASMLEKDSEVTDETKGDMQILCLAMFQGLNAAALCLHLLVFVSARTTC